MNMYTGTEMGEEKKRNVEKIKIVLLIMRSCFRPPRKRSHFHWFVRNYSVLSNIITQPIKSTMMIVLHRGGKYVRAENIIHLSRPTNSLFGEETTTVWREKKNYARKNTDGA